MSSNRLRTTLLTLVIALTPSTAVAQSAGDDQYQDPFGDEAPQAAPPAPSAPSPGPEPDGTSSAPEPATGANDAEAAPAAPATVAPPASTSSPAGELPRTGADAGILGAGGAALVLCGIALRLRLAHGGRRA
ncbi:MAG: hypothetical protein H0V22_02100 [Solirubrobacterales bacterium]|jgi:hypothetical protein|nr:hypothetical protein [Solirubrobacterales bacterium]